MAKYLMADLLIIDDMGIKHLPILTRPLARAIRSCVCGNIEQILKITLADYDKTKYEKGKLTGWF
ncbi:MAG: hypothetical protein ACYC54_14125 [Sedimentisphaerales bacterium]